MGSNCSSSMFETICTWIDDCFRVASVSRQSGRSTASSMVARYWRSTASAAVASSIVPPRATAVAAKAAPNRVRCR